MSKEREWVGLTRWEGSKDAETLSGVAHFSAGDSTCTVSLSSYTEAQGIGNLIIKAHRLGSEYGLSKAKESMKNTLERL
jgi:hypothetical protein